MLKTNKRRGGEGYKVTPRMKIPCVICNRQMTSPKHLRQVQLKNFEEYDKEESPLTKNHLLAGITPCCNHLMCSDHVPKEPIIFNCPFCGVPHYAPDFMTFPDNNNIYMRVQKYHKYNKEPDCDGCLLCPTINGSHIGPCDSHIRDKWMKLFFHRTISFRQLDADNKKIVDFLYNQGYLILDRESNVFDLYMNNEDQFFADTVYSHRTLDQTLACYHREHRVMDRRWRDRKDMFLIRYRADPGSLWPVLHDDNLFRYITSFL